MLGCKRIKDVSSIRAYNKGNFEEQEDRPFSRLGCFWCESYTKEQFSKNSNFFISFTRLENERD